MLFNIQPPKSPAMPMMILNKICPSFITCS